MICPKINSCYKIAMILDKDLAFDWLYAKVIKTVCDKCKGGKNG